MSITLMCALCTRSGDIARSQIYKGDEYLQWRHIDLRLHQGSEFKHFRAQVSLHYLKGHK